MATAFFLCVLLGPLNLMGGTSLPTLRCVISKKTFKKSIISNNTDPKWRMAVFAGYEGSIATRWQGIQCEVVLPTQEWLNITMDGFPYLVCREVIEDVLLCFKCGEEVEKACVTEYCIKAIRGSSVVLHKNLTGHAILNMARHFYWLELGHISVQAC